MGESIKQTMDSHSSYINNRRLQILFMQADSLGQIASNGLKFQDIQSYWYIVERIYAMNFRSIMEDKKKECDDVVNKYYMLVNRIEDDPNIRTKKTLRNLLLIVKKLDMLVMDFIQTRFQYFFRFSTRQVKGLENTDLFNENIFSTKKSYKDEDQGETKNTDEGQQTEV